MSNDLPNEGEGESNPDPCLVAESRGLNSHPPSASDYKNDFESLPLTEKIARVRAWHESLTSDELKDPRIALLVRILSPFL